MVVNSALLENERDDGVVVADIEEHGAKKSAEEMHVFPITTATILFQALLILSAIYLAMLLTNWGAPTYDSGSISFFTGKTMTSYWCQLSAMWISQSIYMFSLLAPLIFRDRTF